MNIDIITIIMLSLSLVMVVGGLLAATVVVVKEADIKANHVIAMNNLRLETNALALAAWRAELPTVDYIEGRFDSEANFVPMFDASDNEVWAEGF